MALVRYLPDGEQTGDRSVTLPKSWHVRKYAKKNDLSVRIPKMTTITAQALQKLR